MSSGTPGRGLAFWILGFCAFVITAIVIHAVWFYRQQHDTTIERALTDSQNLASALEEHTRATIQRANFAAESLADDIAALLSYKRATSADIRLAVAIANREVPALASFVYADETGTVIPGLAMSGSEPIKIDNERYFQEAATSKVGKIHFISQPWAPAGAKLAIAFVHSVHRADGAFAGVVIGTIDPNYFQQIHGRLDLGKNSLVAVFARDGRMIARVPYREDFIGVSFADIVIFQEIAQSRLSGGDYTTGKRDGVVRFLAYRVMPDFPLVVVVGRAAGEVLNPLRIGGWVALAYLMAFLTLIGIISAVMVALARKQDRTNAHLLATLENVNQGVVVFDSDMRLVRCNQRYIEMFELAPAFIRPGVSYPEILRYLANRGEYPGQTADDVIRSRVNSAALCEEQRIVHRRPTGETIIIYRNPMTNGGFIITITDITDDIHAKEEAEAQSKRLQLVLSSIQQGIRVFDKDLKLVLANRQVVETFGYPEEFARPGVAYETTVRISVALGEYGAAETPEALVEERVRWDHEGISNGSVHRTPSGRYVKKQRDPIPGGGFVSTYTDVTELVRIKEELARKSALLELTQEHMGDGISVYDERLRLINFNKHWVEIWDMPPSLARIGTSYRDIMRRQIDCGFSGDHGDADSYIARRVDDLLEKRVTVSELSLADGRMILIRRFAAPNGIFVISHTDITRLKQAETEAARKSTLLETVLDNMVQGILVADADLRIVAYNTKVIELQGYRPNDMWLGMTYEELLRLAAKRGNVKTDDLDSFVAARVTSAHARKSFRREFQAPNGRYITVRRTPMPDGGFVTTVMDVTDRKNIELALQASEERYRSLVMSSAQLIWSTDAEGSVIEPLPSWQAFTGQSDDEVMGWGWIKALHPDDIGYVRRNWLIALETKSLYGLEYRLRRHDGVYRTFSVRGVAVLNADGGVREWVGVCEDISERKAAENEVAAKSALFEATLQNMAQGVTVYDRDMKLVAYNQRYVDLLEFPPGDISLGKNHEECLRYLAYRGDFGPDPDKQVEHRVNAAKNKESYQREFISSNGRTLVVSHTAMPNGGFINTFTDISDRKRAEQALREGEEQLRAILDNIADAVITTDKSGLIQSYNWAAEDIFGYPADEALGTNIRTLIPDSDFQPRNQGRVSAVKEILGRRKDGTMFPIDIAVTSVELPGRWLQIAIVRDIGEQKALQAQLFQASKLATLGEMAAAMAHEMNQPLNVMRMAADNALVRMSRKVASEDYLTETLSLIAAQTERLGKLILHMRVFSRIEPMEFEPFDPRASVTAAAELMNHQLELSNIRLTISLSKTCGHVMGRPSQLEQVVINLLSNAQDAVMACHRETGDSNIIGTVALTVTGDGDAVHIKVSDTGGGIPSDVLGRIFDPFFTTKDVGKGTGLGLSVSYGIVAAMGGKFKVSSSEHGAEFEVVLPICATPPHDHEGQIAAVP